MTPFLRALLVLVLLLAVGAGLAAWSIASRGLSTRVEPSWVEAALAGAMRRWATPAARR